MKIVIDTTVLRQDWRLHSPASLTFLRGLKLIPAQLRVPEVVTDEAEAAFRRSLVEARAQQHRLQRKVANMLGQPWEADEDTAEQDARRYREDLLALIKEHGGEVLPYPDVSHKRLVRRAVERRKPFGESGSGYRDALIWETVRRETVLDERVIFVTNNTRDFADGHDLHGDLGTDLLCSPDSFRLVTDLARLNDEFVLPKLKMLEDVKVDLQERKAGVVDLTRWVGDGLFELLRDEDESLLHLVAGFPPGVGSAYLSSIEELKDLRVKTARELSDSELLIELEVTVDILLSISVDADDYANHAEVREWMGHQGDFVYASSYQSETLKAGINLAVDRKRNEIESEEITYLDGSAGSVSYAPWTPPSM